MKKAAVAGAGIAGIASAIRLAAQNYHVDIFEAQDAPGGKISEIHRQGFRFDTGPSLFTLPELVDELFTILGENPREFVTYEKLTNVTRYFFDDGTLINAGSTPQEFADEIEHATREHGSTVLQYLKDAAKLYSLTANTFIFSPFNLKTLRSEEASTIMRNIGTLDAFRSLHQANRFFFSDERLIKLFDRYATYNGSNPYKTPATLKMISHLEHNTGAYFPNEGMYALIKGLKAVAEKHGVNFHFNTPVNGFTIKNKAVSSIQVNGETYSYDVYLSDIDIYALYKRHIQSVRTPLSLTMQELSSSAMIFYWGINRTSPELDLHNILFASDYHREFHALFKAHEITDDPTVYIFISKKVVDTDAPEGCENWYVMINAPADYGQDWDSLRDKARETILRKVHATLDYDIRPDILFEEVSDPPEIAGRTGSYRGALYGPSSNSRFSAFIRHGNSKKSVKNMYFAGGSVHPGGGIPLCLASAKIATDEIKQ